jgi:hypothetical protein
MKELRLEFIIKIHLRNGNTSKVKGEVVAVLN